MRATSILLGCLLGLGVTATSAAAGTAAANSADTASSNHTNASQTNGRDNAAPNGESLYLPHAGQNGNASGSNHPGNNTDEGTTRLNGGADTSPDGAASQGVGLGWQSLLPGSIQ